MNIDPAYRQAIMDGSTAPRTCPGGTSTEVFSGFKIPVAGKTGTAEKGPADADQSWYAAVTYPDDPQYVVVATDEAGGFGAERAAPMVRQIIAALYDAKDDGPAPAVKSGCGLMAAAPSAFGTAVKGFREESAARIVRIDVLLLVAAIGLIACSIYTLGTATEDDIEGSPYYYVLRQSIYGGVGLALMLLVRPVRLLAAARAEARPVRGGARLDRARVPARRGARGSRRWIELPFFRFQPSELGKVLLILALSAFVIDRIRRLQDRETTRPGDAARADPGDHGRRAAGPRLRARVPGDRHHDPVRRRDPVDASRGARGNRGRCRGHRARRRSGRRRDRAQGLPGGPPDGVHQPFGRPARSRGYQLNQSITAIGAGQKTGRGAEDARRPSSTSCRSTTRTSCSPWSARSSASRERDRAPLFALLIWRALRIMTMSKNLYGSLLAGGICAMLMFQVFVNVG